MADMRSRRKARHRRLRRRSHESAEVAASFNTFPRTHLKAFNEIASAGYFVFAAGVFAAGV